MTICFTIPSQIEDALRDSGQDPSAAAKEAALVELYRLRRINHHQLATALEIDRLEADAILKRHDVPLDLTVAQFHDELSRLRQGGER